MRCTLTACVTSEHTESQGEKTDYTEAMAAEWKQMLG